MKTKVRCALLAGMKDTARSLEQGPLDMCFNEDDINLVATSGKYVSLASKVRLHSVANGKAQCIRSVLSPMNS